MEDGSDETRCRKGLSIQIWPCLPHPLGKASCFQQSAAGITWGGEKRPIKGDEGETSDKR